MPNRLAQETSPYLQQHANNPVDWYAWGPEALALARSSDRPILLSIGYSACHWCHVMAHESFEDPQVAALMNRLFVNIKVDREERPDLDQIYQAAHQMLSRRPGGWPLTMFLMPDGTPYFGGTYFPKESRYNLPGFPDVCEAMAETYRERHDDIQRQNQALLGAFHQMLPSGATHHTEFSRAPLDAALAYASQAFDRRYGGFGGAPKFPHASELEICLREYAASGNGAALEIVTVTLEHMARGGIFDQLGGGFARYSVDESWTIPHFEKMLYDNGPLLRLYADAWLVTRNARFADTAVATAGWVMREMQSPEGAYYSSLDADSEHVEGKYYVWTRDEVKGLLEPAEFAVAEKYYGLDGPANFEHAHWHLRVARELDAVAAAVESDAEQCAALLRAANAKLFAYRERRIRPGRDDKILVSWNALMIEGMARAAVVFGRADWLESAARAVDFIRSRMWADDNLFATYKDGRAHLNAYLDDYAYLLKALLELLQAEFRHEWLEFAQELAESMLDNFGDTDAGGFFFTRHDHEVLLHRPKTGYDNATPAGNAVAAFALQRLASLTGEMRYTGAAEKTLALFYASLDQPGHSTMLMALDEWLAPAGTVILTGPAPDRAAWHQELVYHYLPKTMVLSLAGADKLPPVLAKPAAANVQAWVCQGTACLPPIGDRAEMLRTLGVKEPA
jgi:uncharacterized protein YyaL (SSP411 family)